MIQRLQSVFLFIASASCFTLFGTDVADAEAPVAGSALFADGSYDVFDDPVLMGVFALAGVLFLVDIFLFRNRPLQAKLSVAAAVIALVGAGYGAFRYFTATTPTEMAGVSPDFGIGMPVLALVFGLVAAKYIKADERLVRSADRLR